MPGSPEAADCEGVIHFVTDELIPEQKDFPSGEHTIELSWSRTGAIMRLRLTQCEHEACNGNEYAWHVKEMNGKLEVVLADSDTGRMLLRGKCIIIHNDGNPKAQFWKPHIPFILEED